MLPLKTRDRHQLTSFWFSENSQQNTCGKIPF